MERLTGKFHYICNETKEMDMKLALFVLTTILAACAYNAKGWERDILGDHYFMRYVTMPDDYSGKVRCTIIRKKLALTHKAILYIHGYNDYFFQKEMGDRFVGERYNFYAIDLRKYGRSIMTGQTPYELHDVSEYFADIDAAMNQMMSDGNKSIILMGHSEGGLIAAYYLAKRRGLKYPIKAMILNSPFLDMNLSKVEEDYMLPVIAAYAKISKNTIVSNGGDNIYAKSLLKKYHGEWVFNTDWKTLISRPITSGWLAAIYNAQDFIKKGTDIKLPILLMRSDKSVNCHGEWNPSVNCGDAVLDVNDIHKYGLKLGPQVQEFVVKDAIHDVLLSRKPVRDAVYINIFKWLNENRL